MDYERMKVRVREGAGGPAPKSLQPSFLALSMGQIYGSFLEARASTQFQNKSS